MRVRSAMRSGLRCAMRPRRCVYARASAHAWSDGSLPACAPCRRMPPLPVRLTQAGAFVDVGERLRITRLGRPQLLQQVLRRSKRRVAAEARAASSAPWAVEPGRTALAIGRSLPPEQLLEVHHRDQTDSRSPLTGLRTLHKAKPRRNKAYTRPLDVQKQIKSWTVVTRERRHQEANRREYIFTVTRCTYGMYIQPSDRAR